jgi:hypothetical protein
LLSTGAGILAPGRGPRPPGHWRQLPGSPKASLGHVSMLPERRLLDNKTLKIAYFVSPRRRRPMTLADVYYVVKRFPSCRVDNENPRRARTTMVRGWVRLPVLLDGTTT